jgi:hypothetical protein
MQEQIQTPVKTGRGVPAKGFRMTTNRRLQIEAAAAKGIHIDPSEFANPKSAFIDNLLAQRNEKEVKSVSQLEESFDDIKQKVRDRFSVMEDMVLSTAMGINPSLIISGAAGVGKSTTVRKTVESLGLTNCKSVSGTITPVGLYKLLWETREEGSVLIFDDADSVFDSDRSVDLLKAATDSTDMRMVSWHSDRVKVDEDGEEIPTDFEYNGSIIFISNIDIYREAAGNSKQAPHFQALISRSFVMDLAMKNRSYYLARIEQVLFTDMDTSIMSHAVKQSIYDFMTSEKDSLRELSLRMVKKIFVLQKTYMTEWAEKSRILLCK